MSMIFYSEWPFDNVCPQFGVSLRNEAFHAAKIRLNVSTPQVYELCDMNMIGKLGNVMLGKSTIRSYVG